MATLRSKIHDMVEMGMVESAEKMCDLLLSASSASDAGASHSDYELLADIILKRADSKRALKYYRKALTLFSLGLGAGAGAAAAAAEAGTVHETSSSRAAQTALAVPLKLKVARCLVSLKEFSSAQKELEAVPAEYRDVRVNALLGKLYQMSGLKRHAISSYKLAFEEMPFAVEIIEALVTLGISQAELADLIARGLARCPLEGGGASEGQGQSPLRRDTSSAAAPPRMSHAHNNCSEDYREWLPQLGNALVSKRACSFPDCNLNFRNLLVAFPNNTYLLSQLGCAAHDAGFEAEAIQAFRAARRQDATLVDFMDIYGSALFFKRDLAELGKLTQDLVNTDTMRAETWLTVALFTHLKEDPDKALAFVEKAIQLSPKCARAYRVKGHIFLDQQRGEQAVISYFQACSLERHIEAFRGLVDANLSLRKVSEAVSTAREAMAALPHSAHAHRLLGTALTAANAPDDAAHAFREALRLDPRCEAAAVALADLLVDRGPDHYSAAEALLNKTLSHISSVRLMTSLGKVCGLMGNFQDAIEQLNTAISIAADPSEATAELENIEALMRDSMQGDGQTGALGDSGGGGGDAYSPADSRGDSRGVSPCGGEDSNVGMHSGGRDMGGGGGGMDGGMHSGVHSGVHSGPGHPHAQAHGLDALNGMNGMGLGMSMTSMASSAMSAMSAADLDTTHVEDMSGHGHSGLGLSMGMSSDGMAMSGMSAGSSGGRSGARSGHMGIRGMGALGGEDSMSDSAGGGGDRGGAEGMGISGIAGGSPLGQPDFGSSPAYYT